MLSSHLEGVLVIIPGAGTLGHSARVHRTLYSQNSGLFIISPTQCFNHSFKLEPCQGGCVGLGPVSRVDWGGSFVAPQCSACPLVLTSPCPRLQAGGEATQAGYWQAAFPAHYHWPHMSHLSRDMHDMIHDIMGRHHFGLRSIHTRHNQTVRHFHKTFLSNYEQICTDWLFGIWETKTHCDFCAILSAGTQVYLNLMCIMAPLIKVILGCYSATSCYCVSLLTTHYTEGKWPKKVHKGSENSESVKSAPIWA